MPTGFFTVEQWKRPEARAALQWTPILQLDSRQSLSKAIDSLGKRGKPGLYRVVQTQRCVWAEMEGGKLRLHRSHVSSIESLVRLAKLYESEGGRRPVEKARAERLKAKQSRSS